MTRGGSVGGEKDRLPTMNKTLAPCTIYAYDEGYMYALRESKTTPVNSYKATKCISWCSGQLLELLYGSNVFRLVLFYSVARLRYNCVTWITEGLPVHSHPHWKAPWESGSSETNISAFSWKHKVVNIIKELFLIQFESGGKRKPGQAHFSHILPTA